MACGSRCAYAGGQRRCTADSGAARVCAALQALPGIWQGASQPSQSLLSAVTCNSGGHLCVGGRTSSFGHTERCFASGAGRRMILHILLYAAAQTPLSMHAQVFRLSFGPKSFVVVSDAQLARQILLTNAGNYSKGLLSEILDFVMGKGATRAGAYPVPRLP